MLRIILKKREPRIAMLLIFLSAAIWGLFWVPLRIMENLGMHSIWSNFWFFLVPTPIIIFLSFREVLKDKSNWLGYLMIGICIGGAFSFYTAGLTVASVTKTTVLFYLTPVWATILGYFILNERISTSRLVCIFLGLVGCVLVVELSVKNLKFDRLDLLGLFSGITWSIGAVILRINNRLNILGIASSLYIFSSIYTFFAIIFFGIEIPTINSFVISIIPALFFSLFIILPCFLIVLRVQQYLSPGLVGILMMSEIWLAVISARIFLGETMSYYQWLGSFLIILTGLLISFFEGDKKSEN